VVGRTVEAKSLQVRDEVRDCSFVDALTLTEDVELWRREATTTIMYLS